MKNTAWLMALLGLAGCNSDDPDGGGNAAGMGATGECAMADTSASPNALHLAATEVLSAASPCGFSSCHVGPSSRADLMLAGATDLRTLLVGKPACEAPTVPLVDSAGGEAGLSHSWLWLKLTAPADTTGVIVGDASWGQSGNCGQPPDQPFGLRMPLSSTNALLDAGRLAKVRNWICAGAPGPS